MGITGALMTEWQSTGRSGKALHSDIIVTDDNSHRIAFTCDGANRRLYVDYVLVAEDTKSQLASWYRGLYIGVGSDLSPSTFFTGLIDDVRIYSRAVRP